VRTDADRAVNQKPRVCIEDKKRDQILPNFREGQSREGINGFESRRRATPKASFNS